MRELHHIEGALYLFDGPPDMKPAGENMVCFTSPNTRWLDNMFKSGDHTAMYMPTWSLCELKTAANTLGFKETSPVKSNSKDKSCPRFKITEDHERPLPLDSEFSGEESSNRDSVELFNMKSDLQLTDDEISERFELFGGVARFCLSLDSDFVAAGKSRLLSAVHDVKDAESLMLLFAKNTGKSEVCHALFHLIPDKKSNFAAGFKFDFCSRKVETLLSDCLNNRIIEDGNRWYGILNRVGATGTLRGQMLEIYAHLKLARGGRFQLKFLPGDPRHEKIFMRDPVSGTDFDVTLKNNVYEHLPPNSQSIDGIYLDEEEKRLYLFQDTCRPKHPVNANGIRTLLGKKSKLDRLRTIAKRNLNRLIGKGQENPRKLEISEWDIALIFVVPKSRSDFTNQTIKYPDGCALSSDPERALRPNSEEEDRLRRMEIHSVDALLRSQDPTLKTLQVRAIHEIEEHELLGLISMIPQFLLVIEIEDIKTLMD